MPKKPKFNPVITKIKLCPEQAVLECSCYNTGRTIDATSRETEFCFSGESKIIELGCNVQGAAASS